MTEKVSSTPVAVGDHVRLKSHDINRHQAALETNPQRAAVREPLDGLILSIRSLASGQLVSTADDTIERYVVELLYDNTFNARYASLRNAPRGTERPTATPSWRRMRQLLKEAAAKGQYYTTAGAGLSATPLDAILDGWKIIKVWVDEIESLEERDSTQATGNA